MLIHKRISEIVFEAQKIRLSCSVLFPKKKIPFPDARFKPEMLRRAYEKMSEEARADKPKASPEFYFSLTSKNRQEKTYRDENEFFADSRKGEFEQAHASWSIAQRQLTVYILPDVTSVTVQAPTGVE